MAKYQLVIWDLDGVLVENELQQIDAELETFRQFGLPVTREVALQYMGIRLPEYIEAVAARYGARERAGDMLASHVETLRKYYRNVYGLAPHAGEVLRQMSGSVRMALATNRERELATLVLERFSLAGLFEVKVFGEDVENGKPDPEIYLNASGTVGVEPSRCLVVEDSVNGVLAAKRAGMRAVARRAEHNGDADFSSADQVIDDLRKVAELVVQDGSPGR